MTELLTFTQEPDSAELLEIERAKRLDQTVRFWFVFCALEYAGNSTLLDAAREHYDKAKHQWVALFQNTSEQALDLKLEQAKKEAFMNSFATITIGGNQ
jgi:hypothetical protein